MAIDEWANGTHCFGEKEWPRFHREVLRHYNHIQEQLRIQNQHVHGALTGLVGRICNNDLDVRASRLLMDATGTDSVAAAVKHLAGPYVSAGDMPPWLDAELDRANGSLAFHGARPPVATDYPLASQALSINSDLFDFTLDPERRAIEWRIGPAREAIRQIMNNPFIQRVVSELDGTEFSPGFGGQLMSNNDTAEDAFFTTAKDYPIMIYTPGPSRAESGTRCWNPQQAVSAPREHLHIAEQTLHFDDINL